MKIVKKSRLRSAKDKPKRFIAEASHECLSGENEIVRCEIFISVVADPLKVKTCVRNNFVREPTKKNSSMD